MPIKYIGKEVSYQGKRLMDILCRLNNFGVGRIVYRNVFARYPEVSYYKITHVEPDMSDPTQELQREDRKKRSYINVKGEKVFRGKHMGERQIDTTWKADWRLVPRSEEAEFLSKVQDTREPNVIPNQRELPPLMEYLMKQQRAAAGKPMTEKPMLNIKIKKTPNNVAKLEARA